MTMIGRSLLHPHGVASQVDDGGDVLQNLRRRQGDMPEQMRRSSADQPVHDVAGAAVMRPIQKGRILQAQACTIDACIVLQR